MRISERHRALCEGLLMVINSWGVGGAGILLLYLELKLRQKNPWLSIFVWWVYFLFTLNNYRYSPCRAPSFMWGFPIRELSYVAFWLIFLPSALVPVHKLETQGFQFWKTLRAKVGFRPCLAPRVLCTWPYGFLLFFFFFMSTLWFYLSIWPTILIFVLSGILIVSFEKVFHSICLVVGHSTRSLRVILNSFQGDLGRFLRKIQYLKWVLKYYQGETLGGVGKQNKILQTGIIKS